VTGFERATACLFVTDFDRALAFYRDTLGSTSPTRTASRRSGAS
jgi:catechol 2,3-dioxygenase-like lactoylglutathione lyase family enzyme